MKRIIMLLLILLALPMQAMAAETVQSMIAELPTVEEFQAMDSDAQLEAYNRTQEAYDAYMALTEEEKARYPEAEETFEKLFSYYNTLIAPAEEGEAAESSTMSNVVSTALAAIVGILLAQKLVTKKKIR